MPCHHEVRPLITITEEYVCHLFLNVCDDNIDSLKCVKYYIDEFLNENIKQRMLHNVLSGIYFSGVHSVSVMLELLGRCRTTSIDLTKCGIVPAESLVQLSNCILKLSSPETKTVSISCYIKALSQAKQMFDSSLSLINAIENMKNLRKLVLQGVGDTELLTVIGKSCQQLEHLDISNSPFVEDVSAVALLVKEPEEIKNTTVTELIKYVGAMNPLCKTLVYLGISGTNIGYPGIILSLHVLPNLESFGGHIQAGSVSKSIYSINLCDQNKKFKITNIWDYCITEEQSKCLAAVCPSLISINTNAHSLFALNDAPCLRHFTIKCDYENMDSFLYSYLEHKGHQLNTLRIKRPAAKLLDVATLSNCCPNLRVLNAPLKWVEGAIIRNWSDLEYADVTISSLKCLERFLNNSPNLVSLKLTFTKSGTANDEELRINTEHFINDLLKEGSLGKLESLCIYNCTLGMDGLNSIMENCPKLSYIGKLRQWKLSESQIKNIQKKAQEANWNITIDL